MKNKKGFTLIELLVVVLIIGILAAIALPQYKMAVTKSKVASILPLMRRWKDALMEYQLQHGSFEDLNEQTGASYFGVNWPSDWTDTLSGSNPCNESVRCKNDYWNCVAGINVGGHIACVAKSSYSINMYPPDYEDENLRDKVTCYYDTPESLKICKAICGKLLYDDGDEGEYQLY